MGKLTKAFKSIFKSKKPKTEIVVNETKSLSNQKISLTKNSDDELKLKESTALLKKQMDALSVDIFLKFSGIRKQQVQIKKMLDEINQSLQAMDAENNKNKMCLEYGLNLFSTTPKNSQVGTENNTSTPKNIYAYHYND